jgi:predicted ABC-type ATPase
MLDRMDELVKARETFGFETTLSGRGVVNRILRFKALGYRTVVFYLWLPHSDLANARVEKRVRQGGHSIPGPVIDRRYISGLSNFIRSARSMSDVWWLLDASEFPPRVVAVEEYGRLTISDRSLYDRIIGKDET